MTFWRIANWNSTYENNRTRELKKMDWVPIPNKMDGSGYTELVDHPNGAAHLGIWLAIVEIASKCDVRGTLSQEGAGGCRKPLTAAHLGRMSHLPAGLFSEAIPRFLEIGWLIEVNENMEDITIPQEGAGIPHLPAEECLRARENGTEGKGTEWNGREVKIPPPNFYFHDWFEKIWKRHTNKRDRGIAERVFAESFFAGKFSIDEFDAAHSVWCATEAWTDKQGSFAPKLAEWIGDRGWENLPVKAQGKKRGFTADEIANL